MAVRSFRSVFDKQIKGEEIQTHQFKVDFMTHLWAPQCVAKGL